MKKFLLVFFLLMLCIFGGFAAWFSYSFNAETYRARIIKNLSQMTGRTVEINGPVSLTWTPFPTLVVSNLTLANQENSKTPVMFSVEQVRAEIDWASLLKEPLLIKKVVLEKPVLLLERLRRYETNFDFPALFKTTQNIDPSFLNGQDDFSLSIKEVEIKNGTFTYDNVVAGDKRTFNGIMGIGTVSSLEGPFFFSGTFLMADKPQKIELNIGKIELSQNLPVSLNLTDISSETTIEGSGFILHDMEKPDDWLNLSGRIGSKNTGLFFQNIGIEKWPNDSLVGSFTLKVMTNRTVFESITIRQGEGDTATSFFLGEQSDEDSQKKIPILVVKNIDFDKWKPFLSGVLKADFWGQLGTDFRLQVEEAKINEQSLIQGVAQGRIEDGLVTFSNVTAQLPFNTSLGFKGTWMPKTEKLDGEVQFQSADLRLFLEWILKQKVTSLPQNGIKNAQLMGQIQFEPTQAISDIKVGVLDEAEFSGQINVSSKEKPDIQAILEIKNLNLDKYFQWTVQDLKKSLFPDVDFDFSITAQNLTFKDYTFEQAKATGVLKNKLLSLKEFSGKGKDNSTFKFGADLQNLGTENFQIQNLKGDFEIPNLSNFKPLSGNSFFNQAIELTGNVNYTGQLEKGRLQSDIVFNRATLAINGVVERPFENIQFYETTFSLTHPDIQNFLIPFKEVKPFLPYLDGKLQLSLKGNGKPSTFYAKDFLFSAGKQSLKGEVNWDLKQKMIQVNLTSAELDLNQFFPPFEEIKKLSLEPEIPAEWQLKLDLSSDKVSYDNEKYTSLKTKLDLNNQVLSLPVFSLMTVDKKGSLALNGKAILKNPIIVDGQFTADKIPLKGVYQGENLSFENGQLTLSGNFAASGNSWMGLMQSLRAAGQVSWQNGVIRGIDTKELTSVVDKSLKDYPSKNAATLLIKHALSNGTTNINSGSGSFQAEQGELRLPEFKLSGEFGDIFMRSVKETLLTQKITATLAIILKVAKELPSLDIQLQNGKLILQTEAFEKALEQEAKLLEKQQQANKEKQEQQKAEEKRNEILSVAKEILTTSESQIKQMKDTMALRSSAEGEELLERAVGTQEEVRLLAVRPDLNGEQLTLLQEKANLLNVQSQELKNFLDRQDILRQREAVQKLPPLVKNRITELIQIYNQNSQSAVMAGLVQGSQKEEEKITQNLLLLTKAEDIETAKTLIAKVKESFQKIQKALNYARQLDLAGGITP